MQWALLSRPSHTGDEKKMLSICGRDIFQDGTKFEEAEEKKFREPTDLEQLLTVGKMYYMICEQFQLCTVHVWSIRTFKQRLNKDILKLTHHRQTEVHLLFLSTRCL